MRWILTSALLFALAGCGATMPQTRSEFKELIGNHPSWYLSDRYVTNRGFEEAVKNIDKKWQECYNTNYTATRTSGGMTTSRTRDTYHPKAVRKNNSLVEMTIQMTTEGIVMLDKTPPGGYYRVALDVKRLAGGKTELRWYSPSGWKTAWEKSKQWADGKNTPCED
jgi:hypothetical protein